MRHVEAHPTTEHGVQAVFTVSNSPGWVYVEALSFERAYLLLYKCVYAVCSRRNIQNVDPTEYTSLLTPQWNPGIKQHAWIRVRGGLYHGDLGQVRNMREEDGEIDVAVVPRVAYAVTARSTKRLKKQDMRPRPRRISVEDAIAEYSEDNVKFIGSGYELFGKFYEKEGFRILSLPRNAVEPVKPSIHQIASFIDAAIESIIRPRQDEVERATDNIRPERRPFTDKAIWQAGNIIVEDLVFESLLKLGDTVEIIGGGEKV